ncbi:MAG: DUF3343 domain-containing protein [Veillonellaceae bacterium]|jgi:hypothetical protein|nr:DUF3343 domain-containing protein [Veillonellaceae bacterium]
MAIYQDYDRLVSLPSVHHAIGAEKVLIAAGIKIVAMPTPREIDISCGQCLLFKANDQAVVMEILRKHQIKWSKLFYRDAAKRLYEELASFGEDTDV